MRVLAVSRMFSSTAKISTAADRTCAIDTKYDPLKQHSHRLIVSYTKKTRAKQAADHIDPTAMIQTRHSPGVSAGDGTDRHTFLAASPLIALLRSTRAIGDMDFAYSKSFSSDFPTGERCL